MAVTADVSRLLSRGRRLDIARVVLDAPLTVGEIAELLETQDGAIRTTVEWLAREGLLVASGRPGRRAGVTALEYRVAPQHVPGVRERCLAGGALVLEEDSEVLLVPLTGLDAAARVLARGRTDAIAWAVRTRDPQLSLMIGLRRDSRPEERDGLLLELREDGVECGRLHVGETFLPSGLVQYAQALATGRRRALPPGA